MRLFAVFVNATLTLGNGVFQIERERGEGQGSTDKEENRSSSSLITYFRLVLRVYYGHLKR